MIHRAHPFPSEVEVMLLRINALGRQIGRWALGENWPFLGREFDWEKEEGLHGARGDLTKLISMLEAAIGDENLVGLSPGGR
jgi:hypothetical protein